MRLLTGRLGKNFTTAITGLLVLLLVPPAWPATLGDAEFADLAKDLQLTLNQLQAEQGFPGATAAVALGDGRLIKIATGMADVERGIAMTPDHRLMGGSTGKTYVAAVAVILELDGVWDLDDKLSRYLGDRPWYKDIANKDTMTLRNLLRHRSGVENYYDLPRFHELVAEMAKKGRGIDEFSREKLIRFVVGLPPLFEAGKGYRYTDIGYILIGEAIEAVTGEDYFEVLENRLLHPLGLNLTGRSKRRMAGITQGYAPDTGPLVPGITRMLADNGELKFDPALEFTGGGLVNNSGDMARWLVALYSGRAISIDAVRDITAPPDHPTDRENESGNYYGLGVFVRTHANGPTTWGHGGYFPGYRSAMQYLPEHQFAGAVQLNTEAGVWASEPAAPGEKRPNAERALARLQTVVLQALE